MRAKVVHICLDCGVLLFGKLQSGHGGNSCREHECKVTFLLTVIVSITFVITGGGAKTAKHATQNC